MTSLPPVTRARIAELCEELSLIDIARLALFKMAGPEGLDASHAASMESTSLTHQVVFRVLSKKKQAEMRRLEEESIARREARRAAAAKRRAAGETP